MSVNLITGNLFSPIQASQDSDYQAGTFGEKTQILNVGSKMAVSIVDNSTIRCEDGVLVTREGRRVQIDNGDVVEWTIPTGTQGTTSYYIVGFRLYTDDESAQLCDTFVQLVSGPGATITEDTFRDGAVEIFVSVARVVQNGITLESIESLVPLAAAFDQMQEATGHLQEEIDDINDSIRTNLLNPTAQTQTINGVTFTNNGDGTYTVNGTASADAVFDNMYRTTTFPTGIDTKLIGCPSGGSASSYYMTVVMEGVGPYYDNGDGVEIPLTSSANALRLLIAVKSGTTCDNLLFKPMLTTDLNAKYDDYVPYTGDSGRLNEDVAQINSDLTERLTWKFYSDRISGQASNLPTDWNELKVVIFNSQFPYLYYTFMFDKTSFPQAEEHPSLGYYKGSDNYQVCTLDVKPTSIRLEMLEAIGVSYTTAGQTHQHIYYR